jgi:hypothetical protein
LIVGAIRAAKSAVATSRRQKFDNDDQEKFDCDERARRFDLIRRSLPLLLLRSLSHARETRSAGAMSCSCTSKRDPLGRP